MLDLLLPQCDAVPVPKSPRVSILGRAMVAAPAQSQVLPHTNRAVLAVATANLLRHVVHKTRHTRRTTMLDGLPRLLAATVLSHPQPAFRQQTRPSSAGGMELQLSNQADMYGGSSYGSRHDGRPMSQYGGDNAGPPPVGRSRSRTLAVAEPGRKFSRDGRPILHFGKF